MSKKIILIITLVLITVSIAVLYYFQLQTEEPVACTMEAKACPDGTVVGRISPDCKFEECSPTNKLPDNNLLIDDRSTDTLFYKKESSWGPCSNPDGGCFLNTSFYTSGKVILESKYTDEILLTKKEVDSIIQAIIESGIMYKDCTASPVVDYYATYTINLNGKTKIIEFPGCEQETTKINQTIEAVIGPTGI